ncbi:hypothetical protein [Flocculibacter collagenilyticus]|uniref:hypothetical protein n=1 Tax=Flocculibacter collagenilyticus TaxID=2744479 RepID=UPI0018F35C23|nr:hypothetical protein [Flocculibacter collagenilyticus]
MSSNRASLPADPKLKDINWYKKQITWGELPPFYHMVASSVAESEGLFTHGFDNAVKRILDKRNWNINKLGGHINNQGNIVCETPPRIALEQTFTERGFEMYAYPYAKDKKIDQYVKNNRLMEFSVWEPYSMKLIIRVNQLHKFIDYYFKCGDDADLALIQYAQKMVDDIINFLKNKVNVVEVTGVTIDKMYQLREQQFANDDEALLSTLQGSQQTSNKDK